MTMLQRCQRYLKQNNVAYAHSIHRPAFTALEIASAERIPAHEMTKVVVYFGDNGYGILVLAADYVVDLGEVRRLLDLGEVRRLLDLSEIRLASEVELLDLFPDCEVGAMPPFRSLFDMLVLVDETVAATEFMAFNAGTHQDVIRISFTDFARLVNPLIAAFAVKAPEAVAP